MQLRYCLLDLRNDRAQSRDKTKRAQLGLVLAETLVLSPYACLGKPRDNSGRSGDTQENLTQSKNILFSTESEERD